MSEKHTPDDPIRNEEYNWDEAAKVDIDASKEVLSNLSRQISGEAEPQKNTFDGRRHSLGISEATVNEEEDVKEGNFDLREFIRSDRKRYTEVGKTHKPTLGLSWRDLTVKGAGSGSKFIKTFPDAIISTFGPDVYNFVTHYLPQLDIIGRKPPVRNLINSFDGTLEGGEMMLVLGRPGSGCTTFLKALANKREGFVSVDGDVNYGGLSPEEVKKKFRGEVVMNTEEDIHFPTLTVAQTLAFAIRQKVPRIRPHGMRRSEFVNYILEALLKIFGIEHTANTVVGNDVVRGVSGGERKRVSIAETLVTRASVMCWDNSTRGLDASTAVDYVRSLRIITDLTGGTSIATLYQAGEGIYDLFDKVCVIDEGRCIYFGPANEAVAYFEGLGFHKPPRQTSADFLSGITDEHERTIKHGWETRAPRTPSELEQAYRDSQYYRSAVEEANGSFTSEKNNLDNFKHSVREEKKRRIAKTSPYTVSFLEQTYYCFKREVLIQLGNLEAYYTKYTTIIVCSLVVASLFYGQGESSSAAFGRGGILFFSILFIGWLQLPEIWVAVGGRLITERHKAFGYCRPSAIVIARVLMDIPLLFVAVTLMSLIVYFLASLQYDAGKFWIYYLFVYTSAFALTQFYRAVSALSPTFNEGIRFSVSAFNIAVIYLGYVLPRNDMLQWSKWISYISHLPFAFEAVMANEFHGMTLSCDPSSVVPAGIPGVEEQYQTCAFQGSRPGSTTVSGDDYVQAAFGYSYTHIWPNFGYTMAYAIGYIVATALFSELFSFSGGSGGVTVFAKTKKGKAKAKETEKATAGDIEAGKSYSTEERGTGDVEVGAIKPSEADFTFKDLCYDVQTPAGEKRLLNNITGYVKPGTITALMGASGAGKTTLLNTLSQRTTIGVITGNMLIDGKPLELNSFQRGTGYVQQGDLHDAFATVRESVEFSAILRQPRETPREEVLVYVDEILDLLELKDLEDAIIGTPEAGLGVEQRKRVTIAVELAAKPDVLLFLDEPTSGLDSQSAYSIGRFMEKLARAGQAILCTIHQPSSLLFTEFFDRLLLLAPGGRVVYQGPVGNNGDAIVGYFKKIGARPCEDYENVAEYAIEVIAYGKDAHGKRVDFAKIYHNSEEARRIEEEVDRINSEKAHRPRELTKAMTRTYSQPTLVQCRLLTERALKHYWRDSAYGYGKLFTTVILAIFNGFTFFKNGVGSQNLGQTTLQERMFSSFLMILLPPAIVNALIPVYFDFAALFNTREGPSRIYSWYSFLTAFVIAETPYALFNALVYWLIWYWPVGFSYTSADEIRTEGPAGLTFLFCLAFFVFQAYWGLWLCSCASSPGFVLNSMTFHLVILNLLNGVIQSYDMLPVIWKYTIYYINPITYFLAGMTSATTSNVQVDCLERELAVFNPPPNETCESYAGSFVDQAPGYMINPSATFNCQYCSLSDSSTFLNSINVYQGSGWPWGYFGIFVIYIFTNLGLIYGLYYVTKIAKFSPINFLIASFKKLMRKS